MNTYITSFLIGGTLYSTVNYISKTIDNKNIVLLATFSVLPTSLLSMLYLDDIQLKEICPSYSRSLLILCVTGLFFYYLVLHTQVTKNNSILFSIIFWFTLTLLHNILNISK
jgi:hypothetical protein